MPVSPCLEPRCPHFAVERGRCRDHARDRDRELHPRAPLYKSKRWQVLRRRILQRDGFECQSCGRWGDQVDHRQAIEDDGPAWDPSNLQTLCASCHGSKTRAELHDRSIS